MLAFPPRIFHFFKVYVMDNPDTLSSFPSPWRILIADDHAILRQGLVTLITGQQDMVLVAQAKGGREAIEQVQIHRPDVAVLDVSMPDLNGMSTTERIRQICPSTKILALTRHGDPAYLRRMMLAGAHGYVVKRAASDTLIHAIRMVAAGGTYVDPTLAGDLLHQSLSRGGRDAGDDAGRAPQLSERETQTLKLIAWGKSNREVAEQLGISVKTAEFYKAHALERLNLRTRTDILRYALAEGWLSEEEAPE